MFESTTGPFGPYTAANDLINCSTPDYNPDRNCGGPHTPQRGPGAQQFGVFNIPLANNETGCTITIFEGSPPPHTHTAPNFEPN